jgi:hypothetical protein
LLPASTVSQVSAELTWQVPSNLGGCVQSVSVTTAASGPSTAM